VIEEVAPRAAAIRRAIELAGPQDTVLIAGRGHERWQEVAGVEYALDDRAEAKVALAERENRLRGTRLRQLVNASTPAAVAPPVTSPTTKEFTS
jgi:hypothetical protein